MLWEKEIDNNGVYVNLLRNIEFPSKSFYMHRRKNNAISVQLRLVGNSKYVQGDFEGALIKYNESACMAEKNSEHLGLAYANRSQCFLKLELYERCLIDIDIAKESDYPVHLIPKLDSRKEECLRLQSRTIEKANVELKEMIGPFQIETDNKFGRLARATRDIAIGETILTEKTYIRTVNSDENNDCTNCGAKLMNFIPCENCADAMFCSAACTENNFHKSECDMMIGTTENKEYLGFIIRSIVIGINNFTNIIDLMEFVENTRSGGATLSFDPQSSISKYHFFLKLMMLPSPFRVSGLLKDAYFVFHAIISSSQYKDKFGTTTEKRFLMHLIIHHGIVLRMNAFEYEDDQEEVHELCLQTSLFNHSCLPNIAKLSKRNLSVCKSILRINKGDQLFITYLHDDPFHMTEKQRNDHLEKKFEFRCKCKLCTDGTYPAVGLDNDQCFKYVTSIAKEVDRVDINIVKEKCIEFLSNYSQYSGSQEMYYMANTLSVMFSKELNK